MKVIIVKPFKKPYVLNIKPTLENYQKIVKGYIQVVYPFEDEIALVCNDEGKINNLTPNRYLFDYSGQPYDIICGNFFLCAAPSNSETFEDMPDHLIEKYIDMFS